MCSACSFLNSAHISVCSICGEVLALPQRDRKDRTGAPSLSSPLALGKLQSETVVLDPSHPDSDKEDNIVIDIPREENRSFEDVEGEDVDWEEEEEEEEEEDAVGLL